MKFNEIRKECVSRNAVNQIYFNYIRRQKGTINALNSLFEGNMSFKADVAIEYR